MVIETCLAPLVYVQNYTYWMCSLWREPWSLKGWEPLNEAWSRPFLRIPSGIEIYLLLGVTMEKALAPHSSTLAWKIPWMEEPGRLQSMGSVRVGRHRATSLSLFTFLHWRRKWQSTPAFLPGESQERWSLVSCCLWGRTESDTTEVT